MTGCSGFSMRLYYPHYKPTEVQQPSQTTSGSNSAIPYNSHINSCSANVAWQCQQQRNAVNTVLFGRAQRPQVFLKWVLRCTQETVQEVSTEYLLSLWWWWSEATGDWLDRNLKKNKIKKSHKCNLPKKVYCYIQNRNQRRLRKITET